jgi:hypothetical protein
MENLDGFLSRSKTIQKTRILPLRWIGNFLGEYAGNHLVKAIDLDEALDSNLGFRYKYHAKMWKILDKPYQWWGTYYELDIKGMMDDLKLDGAGWDDYDKNGIPYWEKWEDEGGPVDNSEERLKYMEDNGI